MLYRNNILQEKGCIISICRMKVVIIKDSISGFDFKRIISLKLK